MGPADLGQVLSRLHLKPDANLLVGADTADDAAVYRLTSEIALVSTLDFFTPMLDDAYAFGQVAAANALSDIYAMGGIPFLALNIVAFPRTLPLTVLEEILRGGADKVAESGARLAGGHSIIDDTPKYGLAVSGQVHPERIWTNAGARIGDVLVLTKPLGSGIVCTAHKGGLASSQHVTDITAIMTALNSAPAAAALKLDVHACTDITGFGLIGHLLEVARAGDVSIKIEMNQVPIAPGTHEYARQGLVPGGAHRNRKHYSGMVKFSQDFCEINKDILFDPQTSGGLLFSMHQKSAQDLVDRGLGWQIGSVVAHSADSARIHVI